MRAAEQDRPDVAAARALWRREQPEWDPRHLVFIDETSLNTKMARLYGWSRRGQRCIGTVPHGHWQTPTVLRLIEARGASVRYLPAYSPDLNPIEFAFAKLKSHLRQAAARTLDDLHSAVARSLAQFQPDHCRGFLWHAQYASI